MNDNITNICYFNARMVMIIVITFKRSRPDGPRITPPII